MPLLSPRFTGSKSMYVCTWGFRYAPTQGGSPAEHLGWGARLYAVARDRGLGWFSSLNDFLCKAEAAPTEDRTCLGRISAED